MTKGMYWAVVLLLAATSCDARQRMWKGEVRQSGAVPCFGMPKMRDVEPTEVAAITVSEINEREAVLQTAWGVDFTSSAPPVVLSHGNCILYRLSINSSRTPGPVLTLQPGKRYTVSIDSSVPRRSEWENRSYEACFCLLHGVSGVAVHDVKWNKQAHKRDWAVCAIASEGVLAQTTLTDLKKMKPGLTGL